MKDRAWLRWGMVLALAFLTALALLMDFAPDEVNRLDIYGPVGYLFKLVHIVRLTAERNPVVFPLVWAALGWIYQRCLLRGGARWGEHVLCAALAALMLLSRSVGVRDLLDEYVCTDAGGTVAAMWMNADQLIKSVIFFAGCWTGCLAVLRGLEWLIRSQAGVRPLALKHPFLTPLTVMTLVWLPQLVIRYPGVLHWDTGWTINEYVGLLPLTTHHPPFFIIAGGWLFTVGKQLGGSKVGMLLLTLVLMGSMLCALAHTISTAQRLGVSRRVGCILLAVFCLQPMYSHYATYVAKDSYYMAALLLMMTQMLVLCMQRSEELPSKKDLLLLVLGGTMAALTRKNGIHVVVVSMAALAAALFFTRLRKAGLAAAGCLAVMFILSQVVTGALVAAYDFEPGSRREALSLPFQQTARVALMHGEELTLEERQTIDAVLDLDAIAQEYDAEWADPVKATFRDDATDQEVSSYLLLWARQALRYPLEYVDAAVNLSRELYDPLMQGTDFYEKSSFHDLDGEEVAPWHKESPFYMLNETLMELYYMVAAIFSINLGQGTFLALMAGYLMVRSRALRMRLLAWLPVYLTMGVLLLSPITETRYGLPICLTVPLLIASMTTTAGANQKYPPAQTFSINTDLP